MYHDFMMYLAFFENRGCVERSEAHRFGICLVPRRILRQVAATDFYSGTSSVIGVAFLLSTFL